MIRFGGALVYRSLILAPTPAPASASPSYSLELHKRMTTASMTGADEPCAKLRFADIGINLSDAVFRGTYHGKQVHADDLDAVVQRAREAGVHKMMVTGSDLAESHGAVKLAEEYPNLCYATVGIHPCAANSFVRHPDGPNALLASLRHLAASSAKNGHTVAFGEFGLDYDRLYLSSQQDQLACFEAQLDLAVELQLPLFLHMRAAFADFQRLLKPRLDRLPRRGLVHSFTGSQQEMETLVALGWHIGVNGCSLKTADNLAVVRQIPLDRLQIETDGPWCEMRPSHASHPYLSNAPAMPHAVKKEKWAAGCMIKGRNEPCTIPLVAHVIAALKHVPIEQVCEA